MAKKKAITKGMGSNREGQNPPKDTRFPKGTSGNRKGRPKGSKNLSTLIMKVADEPVIVTVNGKKRRISKVHATAMQLANQAVGGKQAAINKFFDLIDDIEKRAAAARPPEFPISLLDLEVLRAAYERMKSCEQDKQDESKSSEDPANRNGRSNRDPEAGDAES
jgi:hypothetical protein